MTLRQRVSVAPVGAWWALAALLVLPGVAAAQPRSADGIWLSRDPAALQALRAPGPAIPWIRPDRFRAVELEPASLQERLSSAPLEFTPAARTAPAILTLPMPSGGFERFEIVESPVMDPALETWLAGQGWPMRTYAGVSLDHPDTSVRLDWGGPSGFHAMVIASDETYFIDPYWLGDRRLYASYYKRDYRAEGKAFQCGVAEEEASRSAVAAAAAPTNGELRTYRLAMAATAEYTAFHSTGAPTSAEGQAAIVTSVNRVNGIYTLELSASLVLVANNQLLVYTNSGTDPYTSGNASVMLGENQSNVNAVIGRPNYDIGHVVDRSGAGGLATVGIVCNFFSKARGMTGTLDPVNDPFDVDFVSHEIGHQFDASHSWNGANGSCSAGAFSSGTAYEPGSGSTIMAYAGICGADDLQPNSDPSFHGVSLDEMLNYINAGGACSVNTGGVNPNAPSVTAPPDVSIPIGTPFELTALDGEDLDGDMLSYAWEEFDLGTGAPLSTGDDGVQPLFRAWPPTTSPTRVFPRLDDLLAGTTSPGETLPATNRTLEFRVTVRDNRLGGGRVGDASVMLTTTTSSGPFAVTFPNGGEALPSGPRSVTWDVANTTAAPVSAPNVDIFLSTDGGLTYPVVLASGTPNDGAEQVVLPGGVSSARLKVKGSGNIFFDISDGDFAVSQAGPPPVPALDAWGLLGIVGLLGLTGAGRLRRCLRV